MEAKLYFEIECLCALILLLVYLLRTDKKKASLQNRFYTALSFLAATVAITDGLTVRFNNVDTQAAWIITQFSSFYSDSAGHLVCGLWLLYDMMWMAGSDSFNARKKRVWMIPAWAGVVMMCLNIPFHFIYVIDSANVFHRGPYFFMLFVIPFFYIFLSFVYPLVMALREKNKLAFKKFRFLTLMMVLPIIGGIIQLISFGLPLIWPAMTVSLISIYLKLQKEKEQEERLAVERIRSDMMKKQISIMLSQIQPHFLYNALTVIKGLAMTDSDKTCDAIDTFSSYLRTNMDALGTEGLVSFEKELEHTKQYLSIEQMRFGKRLSVAYSIETTSFSLPPLTLQPLVENAVRFGITKRESGGTIFISTKRKKNSIIIAVNENGAEQISDELEKYVLTNIGIQNIIDRVKVQLGGEFIVKSTARNGTSAVITFPVKENLYADEIPFG